MSIWSRISVLAIRPLLPKAARVVAEASGCSVASVGIDAVEEYLATHFGDPSRRLPQALSRAADRAWRALEVAVAGESLWSKLARHGEDKTYSAEVRAFLDANPLRLTPSQDAVFRGRVCQQLQEARNTGLIPGMADVAAPLAKSVAELARFTNPAALCQAEWQAVAVISTDLREVGHTALADLLELRPDPAEPPLLAVAVRFFFRREVETDEELFRGLVYEQVDNLRQEVCDGLNRLLSALETQGGRLSELLAVAEETRDNVLDLKEEQARQGADLQALYAEVMRQGEKLNRLHERALRHDDTRSINCESDRQSARQVVAEYRTLPDEQQRQLPALLNAVGKLETATGDCDSARRDFQKVATLVPDAKAKAEALYNSYQAALECPDWPGALAALTEAARLDPERFAPFPLSKFAPERILGAGGFGVVFLCRDVDSGARVAVKALRTDELDRDSKTVIAEAEQLEDIEHENIIRLRTAGFADAEKNRPFLVMSYFDGVTLEEHVRSYGSLPAAEAREVARQVAAGLMAAHERNILHRDVKPGNVLVRRVAEGPAAAGRWQVKLIDFGLALRRQAGHTTLSNADALAKTPRGQSIAGTLDYAAPEQIGKLAGATLGPYSDVYGFGKTLCFAAFGTPQPGPRHWRALGDDDFGELLGQCIEEQPEARPQRLTEIISRLRVGRSQAEQLRRHKEEEDQPPDQAAPQSAAVTETELPSAHVGERHLGVAIRQLSADNATVHEALELVLGDDGEATYPKLLAGLAHQNWHVRRAAAVIFGHLGPLAFKALPALIERLADPAPEVRQVAMQALDSIDPSWPERRESLLAVPRLVARLEDGSVRCHAVEALSRFGGRAEEAVAPLIQLLSHEQAGVRHAAAISLGKIGSPAKSAIAALVSLLADINNDVQNAADEALPLISERWASSAGMQKGVPALIERLADSNKEAREAAVHALCIIRPGAEDHIRLLAAMLWDARPHAQIAAASVLAKIGASAQAAVPALVANLVDPDGAVRSAASDALAQIDSEWPVSAGLSEAVPKLLSLLDHQSSQIRSDVIGLLGQFRPLTEAAPLLFAALADPDPEVRQLAQQFQPRYHGVGISRTDAEKVVARVVKLTQQDDTQARLRAIATLGNIGGAARDSIPALVSMLADLNPDVRRAVWEALGTIDPEWPQSPGAQQGAAALVAPLTVLRWDGRQEQEAQRSALTALYKMRANAKPLIPELVKLLANDNSAARWAAANALAGIGTDAQDAISALVSMLADLNPDVRRAVWEGLDKIDPGWPQSPSAREGAVALVQLLATLQWDYGWQIEAHRSAVDALSQMGPNAKPVVPELTKLLTSPRPEVRRATYVAVGKIDPEWPQSPSTQQALAALVKFLARMYEGMTFDWTSSVLEDFCGGENLIVPFRRLWKSRDRNVARDAKAALEAIRRCCAKRGIKLSNADLYGSFWKRLFGG